MNDKQMKDNWYKNTGEEAESELRDWIDSVPLGIDLYKELSITNIEDWINSKVADKCEADLDEYADAKYEEYRDEKE